MSAIVAAAAAAIQALMSPFSPNRGNRINVGNDSEVGNNSKEGERDDDDDDALLPTARRLAMTRTTTTTTTTSLTLSGQKRKRDGSKSKTASKKSTTHWGGKTRKAKAAMTDNELREYFQKSLENMTDCGNKKCSCLDVLQCRQTCILVSNYLVWFERKSSFEQNCILADWYKYAAGTTGRGRMKKTNLYMLPFRTNHLTGGNDNDSSDDPDIDFIRGRNAL